MEDNIDNCALLVATIYYIKFEHIAKYSFEEIEYHANQIAISGLLSNFRNDISGGFMFFMLSPSGHELLENIRIKENWRQTKDIAKNVGSNSLDVLENIDTNVISSAVTAYLLR